MLATIQISPLFRGSGSWGRRPAVRRTGVSNVLSHSGDSSIIPALSLRCSCCFVLAWNGSQILSCCRSADAT